MIKKIWTAWASVEKVLHYTEYYKEEAFEKFLDDRYFSLIDEECDNQMTSSFVSSNSVANVKPYIEPEFEASVIECDARKKILSIITPEQNTLAWEQV